jgi:polysaccharide pyruvyl transferase WcaK-like protein
MTKKIALLYSYGRIDKLNDNQGRREFLRGPDNIGNLVYLNVIRSLFKDLDLVSAEQIIENPAAITSQYERVLLPFSNMLSPYFSTPLAKIFDLHNTPISLFSVGLQAPLGSNLAEIGLSEDARLLLEHARKFDFPIGVRGQHSHELLRLHGFESVVVGCPSFSIINSVRRPTAEAGVINATLSGHHQELTSNTIAFGIKNSCEYALQDEYRIIADIYGIEASSIAFGDINSPYAKAMANLLFDYGFYNDGTYSWTQHAEWFRQHSFFYTQVESWRERLQKYSVSIGMRVHGNALALQCGVPALFIPCDLRCEELVAHHNLPFKTSLNSNMTLEEVAADIDYSNFFERKSAVQRNLKEYWRHSDLHMHLAGE